MKAKTWAPAVLAIVLGGVAAKLVRDSMNKPHGTTTVQSAKMMQIVVANSDLIAGQELRAENLTTTMVPTPSTPIDYCTRPAELVGRVVTGPVLKGQEIRQSSLAAKGAPPMLPSLIPPGMRAMTINVDEGNSQAGMVMPGCHVDIVGTFPNGRKSITRTLIKNVLVQAVGTRLSSAKPEDGKEPPPYHTVTLLVTLREAEMIDLTTNSGRMRLLLRGLAKSDNEAEPGDVHVEDIEGRQGDEAAAVVPTPATQPVAAVDPDMVAPAPEKRTVILIKGSNTTKIEFELPRPVDASTDLKPAIPDPERD